MLVTGKQILQHADEHGYAVGAFNVNNMEIIQAIAQAADDLHAPVILQASQGAIKYAGVDYITSLVKTTADRIDVPMTLHLDHGTDFEEIMKCIRGGFTSVMIDASKHELDENIRLTKEIVRIAHSVGVSVEAEIGKIGGTEDQIVVSDAEATYTDPEEARIFVEETGVDSLAIAVGTAHGVYKG
ncbi:MAG: ketose-bisphosphate aldolase, partial [Peptoniphilaceae bacterium]